jgi:coenzyme F420-0:L-glutamate ligase
MKVKALRTRIFEEGETLEKFILAYLPKLKDNSILVVTSKIVALSENRTDLAKNKDRVIKRESQWVIPTKYIPLTIKDGMLMAAAGIDESNAQGKLVLLPKDSFAAAAKLHKILLKKYKIKNLGILITDSRVLPLRAGVVGVALGYAGFKGVKDYRGQADIFGRVLKMTKVDIADSLATAAVLLMGEGNEQKPLAIIAGAPVEFSNKINRKELVIPLEDDLYAPLFGKIKLKNN